LSEDTDGYSLIDSFEKMKWCVHPPLMQEEKIQENKNNKTEEEKKDKERASQLFNRRALIP